MRAVTRSENHSARKLLILLGLQIGTFSAPRGQALDFPGRRATGRREIPKVIHKKLPPSQSLVESSTYPGFREAGLGIAPKLR
jgi:hypothetical protein